MATTNRKWLKRHGFTNGVWRLDERDQAAKAAKERNAHVAEPLRSIVNSFDDEQYRRNVEAGWPDWRNV